MEAYLLSQIVTGGEHRNGNASGTILKKQLPLQSAVSDWI